MTMIRTKLKNGEEAASFWYGDDLVTEFYDKPGAGQSLLAYEEATPGPLVKPDERGDALNAWHQANCDMREDDSDTDVRDTDGEGDPGIDG